MKTEKTKKSYWIRVANFVLVAVAIAFVGRYNPYLPSTEFSTQGIFTGIDNHPCLYKTALCPDKCGHAFKSANFRTTELEGTKVQLMTILLDENVEKNLTQQNIKVGDNVKLSWTEVRPWTSLRAWVGLSEGMVLNIEKISETP
jgi:hypothetical protein